jgi:hypothetical protein
MLTETTRPDRAGAAASRERHAQQREQVGEAGLRERHHDQVSDVFGARGEAVALHLVGDQVRRAVAIDVSGRTAVAERVTRIASVSALRAPHLSDACVLGRWQEAGTQVDPLRPAPHLAVEDVDRSSADPTCG